MIGGLSVDAGDKCGPVRAPEANGHTDSLPRDYAWANTGLKSQSDEVAAMSYRYAPIICAFALIGVSAFTASAQSDNTKANAPGRSPSTTTADQQKNDAADVRITQNVRRAVMQDKSLSTYAHNIKIVTAGGHVTLKGPVRTEREKTTIEAKAVQIAGADNVANEMTVVPVKPAKQ